MSALSCREDDLFIIDLLHVTKRMTKDKDLPFFVSLITVVPFLIKIVLLLLVIYDKASLNLGMGSQSTHVLSGYHADTPITIKAEASHKADSRIH